MKSGLFLDSELTEVKHWTSSTQLVEYCSEKSPDKIAIISVGKSRKEIESWFTNQKPIFITSTDPLPIEIDYETPNTLGIDRIVAAIGAKETFPNKNVLIIDLGTCITYDIVDEFGVFRGGVISPGLKMRMKSMHENTHSLPDISWDWAMYQGLGLGKSTKSCLARGTYQAIIHEIDGFIFDFETIFPKLTVMMTGGDHIHFESKLKEPIFADSNLILKGINRILKQ
jgi:type III pantothenate kinase